MTIIREKKIKPNLHIENNETHKKPLQIINIADPPISTKVQFLSLLIALQSIVHLLHWSLFEQLLDTCRKSDHINKDVTCPGFAGGVTERPNGWMTTPVFNFTCTHLKHTHTWSLVSFSQGPPPNPMKLQERRRQNKGAESLQLIFCSFFLALLPVSPPLPGLLLF